MSSWGKLIESHRALCPLERLLNSCHRPSLDGSLRHQQAGDLTRPAGTSHVDRVVGEPIRCYEHPRPGSMIRVDVTKFGNIPDGGGHKFVGRQQGRANAITTANRTGVRGKRGRAVVGTAFLRTVIDDHSRVAYVEICDDEKAATAAGVLERAVTWFAERGSHRRAGALRQRQLLPPLCLARRMRRAEHQAQTNPPYRPRPTARSNGSTAPSPTAGPTPASRTQTPPAATHCSPGSTSTITTGSTPPSAAHPSAG